MGGRARVAVAAAIATALLGAGCAARSGTAAAPARGAAVASAPIAPPDGKWLRDAEGREYFVQELALPEGSYLWLDSAKTRARIGHGLDVDVVAHQAGSLSIKVYRNDDEGPAAPPAGPSAADRERVAASYAPLAKPGSGLKVRPLDEGLPRRGQWRNGLAVADVDGDGHPDVASGPPRKSLRPPVVFRGDGAGHFAPWQEARFPNLPYDYGDAAVADLNGDGKADLVIASHLRGIIALIGDGEGGFAEWTKGIEFSPPGGKDPTPAFSARAIAIVDWNRDGRPDILALGEGPRFSVAPGTPAATRQGSRGVVLYDNRGDGTWKKLARPGAGNFGGALAVADFDGDGSLDFATGSDVRGFRSLLDLHAADGSWTETEIPELRSNAIFHAIAAADFDRDGRTDLAVAFQTVELGVPRAGIDVLLARGGGWQRETIFSEESQMSLAGLASGDLDADGSPDLVAVTTGGRVLVFRGDGRGGFAREPLSPEPSGDSCPAASVRLADLDGVPGDEIVVEFAGEDDTGTLGRAPSCPTQGSIRAWKVGSD